MKVRSCNFADKLYGYLGDRHLGAGFTGTVKIIDQVTFVVTKEKMFSFRAKSIETGKETMCPRNLYVGGLSASGPAYSPLTARMTSDTEHREGVIIGIIFARFRRAAQHRNY